MLCYNIVMELTKYEQEFYEYFKKKLFLSGISIKTKTTINSLCEERKDVNFVFGKDTSLMSNIIIDFVLYRGKRAIAGIEIIDEPDELENEKGKKLLIDTLFKSMGYQYFRVVNLNKLKEAATIIAEQAKKLK